MNRKKLDKLKIELNAMRHSQQKASALESLARKLGRNLVKRGKEPVWENANFPNLRPLAIPHHGGRDLSHRVKGHVLAQLEDDISAWDEKLEENGNGKAHNGEER